MKKRTPSATGGGWRNSREGETRGGLKGTRAILRDVANSLRILRNLKLISRNTRMIIEGK